MAAESASAILIQAESLYKDVLTDPGGHRPAVVDLVERARAARDREALVVALSAHAWVERTSLRTTGAKALLDEAVRASRAGAAHRLPEVLTARAVVNQELGRATAARRDLDRADVLLDASPSSAARPELTLQQAVMHQNSGHGPQAVTLYRRLLEDRAASALQRAKAANNLALLEAQAGRVGAALLHVGRAQALAEEARSRALVAGVAQTRGWLLLQAGRLPESMAQLDEAAELWAAAGMPLGEPYVEQADALAELRLLDEALALARTAARSFTEHGALLMAVEAQHRVARLALLLGRPDEALTQAQALERSLRGQRRPDWRARAAVVRAEARLALGSCAAEELDDVRRAARTLDRLELVSEAVDAYLVAGRCALHLGSPTTGALLARAQDLSRGGTLLLRLKGRLASALAAAGEHDGRQVLASARAGLRDLATHRDGLGSVELRALASGHGSELGCLALRTLPRSARPVRWLDWMERTRAAALVGALDESPAPAVPRAADPLQVELHAELRLLHQRLARLRPAQQPDAAAEAAALREGIEGLEARLRRGAWSSRGARGEGRRRAVSLPQLRRLLDGQVLVELAALDGRLVAVVAEPRRSRLVELGDVGAVRRERDALLFTLRGLAQPRPAAVTAALRRSAEGGLARLRALLLDPLGVPPDAPLVVVPSSALHGVPWSALHGAPLSVTPSATLWARTRERGPRGGGVLLVAGPDLPGAGEEVRALARLHPGAAVLEPPLSTAASVTAALAGADLAHLACHGSLRSDNPLFSALLLSDGPLTVHEIALRHAAPRRAVLAACDSAADRAYEGGRCSASSARSWPAAPRASSRAPCRSRTWAASRSCAPCTKGWCAG